MSAELDTDYQSMIANAIIHENAMYHEVLRQNSYETTRPSTIYKPKISKDGNQWMALYGENIQEGVAGFGDSPAEAMTDFDNQWISKF